MLYAEVIVGKRTNVEELTYAVTAQIIPYIRLGSLITAPLKKKTVQGVVVGLKRTVPKELHGKIRELIDIDRDHAINEASIKVIHELAEYFGASIAEVAYHFLPKAGQQKNVIRNIAGSVIKPTYLQAPWQTRKDFYLDQIQKNNKDCLAIFSQQSFKSDFAQALKKLPKSVRSRIKLGTIADAFTVLAPESLLIVDQPDHIGGKSARRPFLTTRMIARVRAKYEQLELLMGAEIYESSQLLEITEHSAKAESRLPVSIPFTISLKANPKQLNNSTVIELQEYLKNREKVVLLTSSNNWAPALFCSNCNETIRCPRCDNAIGLLSSTELLCRYCGYTQPRPRVCPKCHQETLVEVGVGVKQLIRELQNHFPKAAVGSLESLGMSDITVATEKQFSDPNFLYDRAVIVGWDRLISGVFPDGSWRLMGHLIELQQRVKSIVIETQFPDHSTWGVVTAEKIREFFESELTERKKYHLPPFGQMIGIIGQGAIRTLQTESRNLVIQLEKNFNVTLTDPIPRGRHFIQRIQLFSAKHFSKKEKLAIKALLSPSWHLDVD